MGNGNGLLAGLVVAAGAVAAAEDREEAAALPELPNPLVASEFERSPKLGRPPKLLFDGRLVADEFAELDPVADDPNGVDETDGAEVEPDREDAPPNGSREDVPSDGRASAVDRDEADRLVAAAFNGRELLLLPPPHAGRSVGASFSFDASVSLVDGSCTSAAARAVRLFVACPKEAAVALLALVALLAELFRRRPLLRLLFLDAVVDAVRDAVGCCWDLALPVPINIATVCSGVVGWRLMLKA